VVLVLASRAGADVISVAWSPVVHPDLAGYRVRIAAEEGSFSTQWDLPGERTDHTAGVLAGDCRRYCVSVFALDDAGGTSAPTVLCGLPDPEVANVAATDDGWTIFGDNFAEDVQVWVDGGPTPVSATRVGCGELRIPLAPLASLVVRNPSDGVGAAWSVPATGYLLDQHPGAVIVECGLVEGASAPTLTRLSQTPGLALGIEADLPGLGTDCAGALAAIVQATGASPAGVKTLSLGSGGGVLYVVALD
jgi:hypothetical protein